MYSQAPRHFTLAHPLLEQPRCRHPLLLQLLKVPPHTRCIPHSRRIAECIYIMQASIEEPMKVHSRIQPSHLVRVAIKGQSRSTVKLTDPSLSSLTPAGVIDCGIDVRVKAVLAR